MAGFNPQNAYITPASPVVVNQIARLNENADDLLFDAQRAIETLQSLSFANVDLDPRFQYNDSDLANLLQQLGPIPGFDPNEPFLDNLDLSAGNENFVFSPQLLAQLAQALPDFIVAEVPEAPPLPQEPSDPGDQPDPVAPIRPDLPTYVAPDIDTSIPLPEYQDYTSEVPFPTLRPITLPEPPVVNIDDIQFVADKPVFRGTDPDPAQFQFENAVYDPLLLDQLKATVLNMMNGQSGLPPGVEDALYERAREREVELGEREVTQANEEWAARGFRMPTGALARRADRIRLDTNFKVSALSRDQYIETWRIQIEQLRQALAQGVALEDLWMRQFIAGEDRRLQATQIQLQLTIQIYNAYIARYNADAQVFQVEAQVYRDRIQAELAKVQVYSEELRAAQIIGELNEQDVRIFAERLRALQINTEIYKARIDAYTAQFQAAQSQVDIFRAQLESNQALVNIYEADTRAFGEMVRASLSREERFRVKADMYGKNVDAWVARYNGVLEGYRAQLEGSRLKRDVFTSNTERLAAFSNAESGRIQALVQKYQAIVAEITSKQESEKTKYELMLRISEQAIERMKTALELLLKNGEINIQSGLTAANLMLRANETAATTLAQLAAGMTSAANVNASISDSSSSSIGYSFSGKLDTSSE